MSDIRDFTGKNRKFTGTDSIKVPTGTTAQRVNETAKLRFNSDTNLMEYYTGTDWKPIDSPPTVTQIAIAGRAANTTGYIDNTTGGDQTIVISGSLFDTTGAVVTFEGTAGGAGTVTTQTIVRNSSSQLTVTVTAADFIEADDPYTVKVTNGSGLSGVLAEAIDVNVAPAFATAADTNIGTVQNSQSDFSGLTTVAATDADGDTITHTISAGSLPSGMSLATDGTFTGTASGLPSSVTNYTFTVQAATTQYTITRQFVVSGVSSLYVGATGGTESTVGSYKYHTFNSSGNFIVSETGTAPYSTVDYLLVAGGGGGGPNYHGAGAGAGGAIDSTFTVSATTYGVVIGSGGSGGSAGSPGSGQSNGQNSTVFSQTALGGGYGGNYSNNPGNSGGSGGGGAQGTSSQVGASGTPGQGNNGGNSVNTPWAGGGGGGGKGAVGGNGTSDGAGNESACVGGAGGTGINWKTLGTYYAGGGAGSRGGNAPSTASGPGGGGTPSSSGTGASGTANTGGGGGGGERNPVGPGGSGGSGKCIIRYQIS